MCGIIGSFTNENNETQRKKVEEAINFLNHRGPDSKGLKQFSINHSKLILKNKITKADNVNRLSINQRSKLTLP